MLFPVSLALLIFSSAFLVAKAGFRQKLTCLLALFIISFAQIVLISQIASLFNRLNLPFFIALQALIFILSGLIWWRGGKPNLLGPWRGLEFTFHDFAQFIKLHPVLGIWLIISVLIYILHAVLILLIPQNNYDSMTYHLSRVAYWIQHQSLAPWPTPNPRQTTFPINAELGVLWTVLFTGGDRWSGFVQWICVPVIAGAIYGVSRLLNASRPQGLFAGLLFANFTGVLLQSTTTQNDLVIAAFFIVNLYFLFLARREYSFPLLLISAVALGLSLGTKSTFVFVLPAFAVCILIDLALKKFHNFRFYFIWGSLGLAGFLLFGAFGYVQNQIAYQDPFSDRIWTGGIINVPISRTTLLTANTIFYSYQMLDFSAVPEPAAGFLNDQKAAFFTQVIKRLPLQVENAIPDRSLSALLYAAPTLHEDTSWYSFLAFLVLTPAAIYQFIKGLSHRKEAIRWMLILLGFGFVLTLSAMITWSPYKGRYFILPIAVITPLTYSFYSNGKRRIWSWLIAVLSVFLAVSTVLNNPTKSLVGRDAFWANDYLSRRTITNRSMSDVIRLVEDTVPDNGALATRLGQDDWDYPLFGRNLERTIVQLDPHAKRIDVAQARALNAEYLLISPVKRTFLQPPDGLEFIGEANGWLLFSVLQPGEEASLANRDFSSLQDPNQLVFLDQQLYNRAGVIAASSTNWGVENFQGHGIYWIGENSGQGLHIYLWAEEAIKIGITYDLTAGPGIPDPLRKMRFTHWLVDPYLEVAHLNNAQDFELDGRAQANFQTELKPGLNKIILFCLDEAIIRLLPNGDRRPLLVMVNRVDVLPGNPEP